MPKSRASLHAIFTSILCSLSSHLWQSSFVLSCSCCRSPFAPIKRFSETANLTSSLIRIPQPLPCSRALYAFSVVLCTAISCHILDSLFNRFIFYIFLIWFRLLFHYSFCLPLVILLRMKPDAVLLQGLHLPCSYECILYTYIHHCGMHHMSIWLCVRPCVCVRVLCVTIIYIASSSFWVFNFQRFSERTNSENSVSNMVFLFAELQAKYSSDAAKQIRNCWRVRFLGNGRDYGDWCWVKAAEPDSMQTHLRWRMCLTSFAH